MVVDENMLNPALSQCRHLSTFRVCEHSEEARAYSNVQLEDTYKAMCKGQVFEHLPDELKEFQMWQPSFRLVAGPGTSDMMVVFRSKPEAEADKVKQWREQQANLPRT